MLLAWEGGVLMSEKVMLTRDAFQIDAEQWCGEIESFIRREYAHSNRSGIVVTLSGGLDSSVTAALCVRALGRERVIGLLLPERGGNPEAAHYASLIAKHLGIQTAKVNISPILRAMGTSNYLLAVISGRAKWKRTVNKLQHTGGYSAKDLYLGYLKGDLSPVARKLMAQVASKQRARLLVTYQFAEEHNLLVAGSAHQTEQMVGLFVKYGIDDGADLMPLKNLYRSHTLQLARYMKIPAAIIGRTPNPDILPGITDKYEDYFGMDYLQIELIALGVREGLSDQEIARQLGIKEEAVKEIREIIRLSAFVRSHGRAPEWK